MVMVIKKRREEGVDMNEWIGCHMITYESGLRVSSTMSAPTHNNEADQRAVTGPLAQCQRSSPPIWPQKIIVYDKIASHHIIPNDQPPSYYGDQPFIFIPRMGRANCYRVHRPFADEIEHTARFIVLNTTAFRLSEI